MAWPQRREGTGVSMTSRQYDAIDELLAAEIKRLHKRYPKLGHDGLLDALVQQNIHVDPQELATFMARQGIKAERIWQPWKWVGLPIWYGGRTDYRPARRWRLWRKRIRPQGSVFNPTLWGSTPLGPSRAPAWSQKSVPRGEVW